MDKKKILVVDDEPVFLDLLRIRLESKGYEVDTASSGKEALRKVRRERPDAVLLDILMPKVNGLDILKEIRSYDKRLPVFMVTAFSNEERFKLANKLNASGFIVKTSDLKDELKNIDTALRLVGKYKTEKG